MKVHLIDNYYLTSDANNFILNEEVTGEKGKSKNKKRLEAIGFYPTILQALEGVITKKMSQSNARTLSGLLREHRELVDMFCSQYPSIRTKMDKQRK